MAEQRAHWHERLAAEPAARLVFVDESGANTKMTRRGGRAPVGQRLVTHIPHGHYQTSTLIAAVRLAGACAPWLFEGAMDGEMFLAWVRQGLVPTLQPGDLVILDNLATHKVAGVREAIESVGAVISSLPLLNFPKEEAAALATKIRNILEPRGRWVQYSYQIVKDRSRGGDDFRLVASQLVWLNLPPARVSVYQK